MKTIKDLEYVLKVMRRARLQPDSKMLIWAQDVAAVEAALAALKENE